MTRSEEPKSEELVYEESGAQVQELIQVWLTDEFKETDLKWVRTSAEDQKPELNQNQNQDKIRKSVCSEVTDRKEEDHLNFNGSGPIRISF